MAALGASEAKENPGSKLERSICKHSMTLRTKRFLSCSGD